MVPHSSCTDVPISYAASHQQRHYIDEHCFSISLQTFPDYGQDNPTGVGTYPPRGQSYSVETDSYFNSIQVQIAHKELTSYALERSHHSACGQLRFQESITDSEIALMHDLVLAVAITVRVPVVVYYILNYSVWFKILHIKVLITLETAFGLE